MNINRLPVGVADTNSLSEGLATTDTSTVSGNVLTDGTDDSDQDAGAPWNDTLSVAGVAAGSVAGPLLTNTGSSVRGSYGNVTIAANGTYTYTLDNQLDAVQRLAAGESITDTFSYTVTDSRTGFPARTTTTLTITINGTNDAPRVLTGAGDQVQLTTGTSTPTIRIAIPSTGVVAGNTVRLTYLGQSQTAVALTAADIAQGYVDVRLTIPLQDAAGSLDSVPVKWVDWTSYVSSGSTHTVDGTFTTESGTITTRLTNTSGFQFVMTNGLIPGASSSYGGANYFVPGTPYTSTGVLPPTSSDIIAFNPSGTRSLTFSSPVTNLYFAYVSMNGNGYRFDRDFDIISQGAGYFGNGTTVKNTVVINGVTYYELQATGGEPHGVIRFKGTFSSVTWISAVSENWNGFTLGIKTSSADLQNAGQPDRHPRHHHQLRPPHRDRRRPHRYRQHEPVRCRHHQSGDRVGAVGCHLRGEQWSHAHRRPGQGPAHGLHHRQQRPATV